MDIKIFGCRFNKYYAQKWLNKLKDKEGILIASCAVTDNAKRKFIKETKQQIKKGKTVYLTGCGAFSKDGEIDPAWFYTNYPSLLEYKEKIILLPENPNETPDNFQKNNKLSDNSQSNSQIPLYTKGFVIVQLGCDSYCTFCITVKKRGQHKNRSINEIIAEIKQMEENGIKEIVLTGINLAAWGLDTTNKFPNPKFPILLEEILKKTSIPRIRISSIGPEFIDNNWFDILENERILPYFHLSIQSGSDKILAKMGRKYKQKDLIKNLEKLSNLNKKIPINIGADIIVGFPGETKEDFNQTKQITEEFITKLHVFPFSSHQIGDTVPASKFGEQIDINIKKEREKILKEICDKNYEKLKKRTKGKKTKVLIEKDNQGWTENYIKYKGENLQAGKIYEIIY